MDVNNIQIRGPRTSKVQSRKNSNSTGILILVNWYKEEYLRYLLNNGGLGT